MPKSEGSASGAVDEVAVGAKKTDGDKEKDGKESTEGLAHSSLPKHRNGTLKMKPFVAYLPKGEYLEEMKKYMDLDVLFVKLKYNEFFNKAAETEFLHGTFDETKPLFRSAPLRIVWGDDTENNTLNAYRVIVLLLLVRFSLKHHKSCEETPCPTYVITDIHGQFSDLLRWLFKIGGPEKIGNNVNYICTGDMVDRGLQQLETVCLFLYYKLRYPGRMFLLRGNHEDYDLHESYGFLSDCNKRFLAEARDKGHRELAKGMWYLFVHVFDYLPTVCLVEKRFMCVHGGISPLLTYCHSCQAAGKPKTVTKICDQHIRLKDGASQLITLINRKLVTPLQVGKNFVQPKDFDKLSNTKSIDSYNCLFSDLLWSDPKAPKGRMVDPANAVIWGPLVDWSPNEARQISFMFGHNCVEKFCNQYGLACIVRGHEPKPDGYEWHYKKACVTLFSAPNYTKGNDAAVGLISESILPGSTRKLRFDPIGMPKTL